MQLRVFNGSDLQGALHAVKRKFGPDALILRQRHVPGRRLRNGLAAPGMAQITAAFLEDGETEDDLRGLGILTVDSPTDTAGSPRIASFDSLRPAAGHVPSLRSELDALRSEVQSMGQVLARPGVETKPAPNRLPTLKDHRPSRLQRAIERLGLLGLEAEYARDLANDWFDAAERDQPGARTEIEAAIRCGIDQLCHADSDISPRANGPRVIAVVGPTGVGKTTTIAKIAAREVLESGRRVALLTCDNYRIAAIEQLRAYARIIGVPLRVVENSSELTAALRVFHDFGLILIDTPGLSPRSRGSRNVLNTLLAPDASIEKHLALSSTTKTEELMEVWQAYSVLGIDRLIFTKIDESVRFGCLLPTLKRAVAPVAFLANGQRVPEDFEPATIPSLRQLFDGCPPTMQ